MRKGITAVVIIALLGTGGYFAYNQIFAGIKTVTAEDGTKYRINMEAVKENAGFAKSDADGNLTPLEENDPDAASVAAVVMEWADKTSNRSWEDVTGDEEYHLYSESLKKVLINEQDDINQTRMGYEAQQTATQASNIKATNVVIFSDGKHAYAVCEWDSTLLHSIDLEGAKEVGFDGIGSTKQNRTEFELEKDSNGDWKITAVNNISDWKVR